MHMDYSVYFRQHRPFKSDTRSGVPEDKLTVDLLHKLDDVASAGGATFYDIANLIALLAAAEQDPSIKFPAILGTLYFGYFILLNQAEQAHGAWAQYLIASSRVPSPTHCSAQFETDPFAAMQAFRADCGAVQTRVEEALIQWKETFRVVDYDLSNRLRTSQVLKWLLYPFDAPFCVSARRRALLARLPSLRSGAERNLRRFANAYKALEGIMGQIEAQRREVEATDVPYYIFANAVIALDCWFVDYKMGLVTAKGEACQWPFELCARGRRDERPAQMAHGGTQEDTLVFGMLTKFLR
ncbi:hypothetical protein DFH07DRAFT_1057776 [Mycena maculata]|uniref:Uncharacterized protein n=1 Tax=Mycena maculata TaxID=230809 RepID=A0AAD7NQ60_9AGAR|nr:hypothetical protein DFH07DRAFT_1057776 [Mycena maculata]